MSSENEWIVDKLFCELYKIQLSRFFTNRFIGSYLFKTKQYNTMIIFLVGTFIVLYMFFKIYSVDHN